MASPNDREEALFLRALKLNGEERRAFLDRECSGDSMLRQRLDALLTAHEEPETPLQPRQAAEELPIRLDSTAPPAVDSALGLTIGRYKLIERLGEGGCGVVYVAEQTEPVRRRVALKVIKPGMDTKAVIARFEAERQALAMMDHPNIAKVFDAGTTDSGRPYFVMEWVRGVRITEYCNHAQLSIEARVELFIRVCQAIQHAHQKGIIHRDIKPSNILVTHQDGAEVPKVIDFGIAKATEGRLANATVHSQLLQFLGTPAYMSPEQAEINAVDIDTRSDIYSLGALLYELLTGRPPFDPQELIAAGFDSMRQTIREKEAVKPSTRLVELRALPPQTHPGVPALPLAKDLDWIVMKCLEKDRARRYETANGLAADLKRFLANEQVVACPPSTAYRLSKAFQRNKLVFVASAAVTLALFIGLGVSLWQWRNAEEAREFAELRATAEAAAKTSEARERVRAEQERARSADLLCALEIQKATELFLTGKPSRGLAQLARLLREHPTHRTVVDTVVSSLSQYSIAWPKAEITGHRNLRFSPNGRRFLTVSNQVVQVWDTPSGQPALPPLVHEANVTAAEFSPRGDRVVTESGHTSEGPRELRVWEIGTDRPASVRIPVKGFARTPSFSPDGRWILAAVGYSVSLWNSQTGEPVFTLTPPVTNPNIGAFASAQFSPNGRKIVTTTARAVQVWDASTGLFESALSDDVWDPLPANGAHRLSRDGDRWATFSTHILHTWDVGSGRRLARILPGSALSKVEFSPDGQRILTACADRNVRIWDSGTGQPVGESLKHETAVISARFSPNGQWVLTVCSDGSCHVWDAASGQLLVDEWRVIDRIEPIGYWATLIPSPNGHFIAAEGGSSLRIWEFSMAPLSTAADRATRTAKGWIPGAEHGNDAEKLSNFAPVLPWFPELIEAAAGLRVTGDRAVQVVPFAERQQVRSRMGSLPKADGFSQVAQWICAERESRTVSPFSTMTLEEYVHEQIRQGTLRSLHEALRLAPASGLAMSRLAVHVAAQDPSDYPRRAAEADYFSQRGLEQQPDNPHIWVARADVLAATDRIHDALEVNDRATQRFPGDPELWNQRGTLFERAASHAQAEPAYSRAIELAHETSGRSPDTRAQYLFNRSDAWARQGRTNEAAVDRRAALQLLRASRRSDSPQWGGNDPGRNLYSPASGLPSSFELGPFPWGGEQDPELSMTRGIRFVVALGSQSYETLAVANGKIFVGTNNDRPRDPRHQGDRSILMCLDEEFGAFLRQLVIPKLQSGKVNDWEGLGLLSTPVLEGNRLYLVTTRGEVLCLTTDGLAKGNVGPFQDEQSYSSHPGSPAIEPGPKDADIVWRYDMMDQLGVFPHNGTRSHPLVVGDLVFVGTCNGMDWTHVNIPSPHSPSLIALNKHTGELVGEDDANIGPRIFHGQWSSPSTGKVGDRQLIFYGGGDGFCYAFDAIPVPSPDGPRLKRVWQADCNPPEYRTRNGQPIRYPTAEGPSEILATPVFWKDRVYVAIGQDPEHGEGLGNLVCLDATREGDISRTGIVWSYRGIQRSLSTVAITPDGLLFVSDFTGFVHCVDAETGRPYWTHDMRAHIWGSTLVADGKVYVGDEDGDFVVFAAQRTKKILSSMPLDGRIADGPNLGAPMYTTPIVANGVIYFSSSSHFFAVQETSSHLGPMFRRGTAANRSTADVPKP